jgi:hypothetical protein
MQKVISDLVTEEIDYLSKVKDSYTKDVFWRAIKSDVLRGQRWADASEFSHCARAFAWNIVDECMDLDALLDHVTTSPNSIGDYWLDKKIGAIVFSVETSFKEQKS